MQQSNATPEIETIYVYADDYNTAEVYTEPKAENLMETSQKPQETHASTLESGEAQSLVYERPFRAVCEKCNQRFSKRSQFKYHMKTIHAKKELLKLNKCKICLYEFVNNTALVNHMRLHTGEKPFACETCDKKFAFKVALVKHYCIDGEQPFMRRVTSTEEPKICDICHEQFESEVSLANHKRKHETFTCNTCQKKFVFKSGLVSHVCINGEKPYMTKCENNEVSTLEPIDNTETVKEEKIERETDVERRDWIEIKIERDELESGDIGMAEIKVEAIKTEIKEED